MKKILLTCGLLFLFNLLAVQETLAAQDLLDMDFDAIFYESLFEDEQEEQTAEQTVLQNLRRSGITVNASYRFRGAIAPGWDLAPWDFDGNEKFSWGQGVDIHSNVRITAQISEVFRVITEIRYSIPGFNFELGDFFFDYNFFERVFLRAGRFEQNWGISPNFAFTNLLSRVPADGPFGHSYVIRADIPVGVGGIQLVGLTRSDISADVTPALDDIGFGAKYNLALRRAGFDFGVFYQSTMATRAFLSINTTLWNIEFYKEQLVAVNTHSNNAVNFSANIGFFTDLFNNRIMLNGELFYNGERSTSFFRPETEMLDADKVPFIEGFNIAFNVLYRFSGRGNPRFFTQFLYAPEENSARIVPGFTFTPFSHIEVYFAVPMALGSRDGHYFNNTLDPVKDRPFVFMFFITLRGGVTGLIN